MTEQALPARSHGLWLYYRATARDRAGFACEVAWLGAMFWATARDRVGFAHEVAWLVAIL